MRPVLCRLLPLMGVDAQKFLNPTFQQLFQIVQMGVRHRSGRIAAELEADHTAKHELIVYLDYYDNRRIKAKRKGLPPALYRQQALSAV